MPTTFQLKANFVDIPNKQIYPIAITVADRKIVAIDAIEEHQETYI